MQAAVNVGSEALSETWDGDIWQAQSALPSVISPATWVTCAGHSTCSSRRRGILRLLDISNKRKGCASTGSGEARSCL